MNLQPTTSLKEAWSIWQLAWPIMLSNITVPLLGLVDTAVVGHLPDAYYLGALSIGSIFFTIIYWAFGFLRMGTTGLVAQAEGRDDLMTNSNLLLQGLVLAVLIGGALIAVSDWIIHSAIQIFEPTANIADELQQYAEIRIYGAPAALASFVLIGWFIGNQNTRIPLMMLLCANLLNMVLDILAVWVFDMNTAGIALATVCSDFASVSLGIYFAVRWHRGKQMNANWKTLLHLERYLPLLRVNRYLFIRTLAILFAIAFFTAQGVKQGDNILSANAVLLNFLLLISNALDGFAHAIEARTGRLLGMNKPDLFYRNILIASFLALFTAILLTFVFLLFGKNIIYQLTDIPSVREEALVYLPWLICLPLVGVWSFMLDGIFVGSTQVKAMQNTMLFSVFIIFIPLWWLTTEFGNHGLWFSFLSIFLARAISGGYVFYRLSKQRLWTLSVSRET